MRPAPRRRSAPRYARELEAGREFKRVREGVMAAAATRAREQVASGEDPADKRTWGKGKVKGVSI